MSELPEKFEDWIEQFSPETQAIMREFNPGTEFVGLDPEDKRRLYVTGVGEPKKAGMEYHIFVSSVNPLTDYDRAVASALPIPLSMLRAQMVTKQ